MRRTRDKNRLTVGRDAKRNNTITTLGHEHYWPGTTFRPVVGSPPAPQPPDQAAGTALDPLGQTALWPGLQHPPVVYRPPPPKPKTKPRRKPRIYLPAAVRRNGIYIVAGRGSGKSRLMGRGIAWGDFQQKIPQLIIDPVGGTITNFLDKVVRLPPHEQKRLWPRIRYIDLSGKRYGRVFPFPLYYRLSESDSYNDIAWRYLDALIRLDPKLQEAPKLGWNSIVKVGVPTGVILAALGWQITEAQALLTNPLRFEKQLNALKETSPDRGLHQAVAFFTEQDPKYWQSADWRLLKDSFETKNALFTGDNTTMAMFGSSPPAIDWDEVVNKRLTVLLDCSGEHNRERRRFKLLWGYLSFFSWLKQRGQGRHTDAPIALMIDEISALYNFDTQAGSDIFAADLDELINIWSRNANCWITLSQQERWQTPSRKAQKTLWSLGTKIIGNTSDHESAMQTAQDLIRYDPHQVKRYERVWMSDMFGAPFVVDETPVDYSVEEQQILASYRFKDLGSFRFYIKQAKGEGDVTGPLERLNTASQDRGIWPDEVAVPESQRQLATRDGSPPDPLLAIIDDRLTQPIMASVILPDNAQERDLPATEEEDDDDSWRDEFGIRIPRTPEIAEALKAGQTATE